MLVRPADMKRKWIVNIWNIRLLDVDGCLDEHIH